MVQEATMAEKILFMTCKPRDWGMQLKGHI